MKNFISYFMEMTKEGESPDQFWRWSALSAISAAMRNHCYYRTGLGFIYPNLYVIIHSDSGVARKAAGPKMASELLRTSGATKLLSGRATLQAVIRELGNNFTTEKGQVVSGAAALLYSEELSAFLVSDPATIPLLIDLYDFHKEYNPILVSSSTRLKDVCVCLLAASNSDLFNSVFTAQAVKGGLLGRTLIVTAKKARHRKSLLDIKPSPLPNAPLVEHLQRLGGIRGAVEFEDDAASEVSSWYYSLPDEIMNDKIGFASRMETHVIKVAMCLAAARGDFDKVVFKYDVEEAIQLVQDLRSAANVMAQSSGHATSMQQVALIVKAIADQPGYGITRTRLVQRTYGDFKMEEMDELLTVLMQGGFVQECSVDAQPGYRLTPEGVNKLIKGETDAKPTKSGKGRDYRDENERILQAGRDAQKRGAGGTASAENDQSGVQAAAPVSSPAHTEGGDSTPSSDGVHSPEHGEKKVASRIQSAAEIWGLG